MRFPPIMSALIIASFFVCSAATAELPVKNGDASTLELTPTEKYAQKLYIRITGSPANLFDPRFRRVVDLINRGDKMGAARVMTETPNFLNVRMRNFTIPYIDKSKRPVDTFTDLQALIIGITRDDLDARLILTGDLRYSGYSNLGLPAVTRSSNDHYAQFESRAYDFGRDLERVDKQWDDVDYVSGALTTRAWAAAYYNGGTNRLAVKYAFEAFLCSPIDEWKIRGLPDFYVRRDIDRAEGGKPQEFQNNCRNCHSPMDSLGGAFAKLDFVDSAFVYLTQGVAEKMNKNTYYYPAGFVTTDDSWINMLESHPTVDFGWRGTMEGRGVAAFGKMLAASEAYSRCFVQKAFSEVCGKNIRTTAPELLKSLTSDFEANSYSLKYLFGRVAMEEACVSKNISEVQ